MSNGPWTDEENDLIVADYFAMLADDSSARRYSKAEHRRALLPLLNHRSESAPDAQARVSPGSSGILAISPGRREGSCEPWTVLRNLSVACGRG